MFKVSDENRIRDGWFGACAEIANCVFLILYQSFTLGVMAKTVKAGSMSQCPCQTAVRTDARYILSKIYSGMWKKW
jgi:hypothetical protein